VSKLSRRIDANAHLNGRVRRADLKPKRAQTDAQLLASALRSAQAAQRRQAKDRLIQEQPRSYH
jgi:hypothetical protein